MTIYSTLLLPLPMSNFFQGAQGGPTLRPLFIRRPAGLLGDGAHTVPPRAANVFHRYGGPPDGGPPPFRSTTEQKATLASAPSPGQSIVFALNRHFGMVCLF